MGSGCFLFRPTKKFSPQNEEKTSGENNLVWAYQNTHVHNAHGRCLLVLASFYLFILLAVFLPFFFLFLFLFLLSWACSWSLLAKYYQKKKKNEVYLWYEYCSSLFRKTKREANFGKSVAEILRKSMREEREMMWRRGRENNWILVM